MQQSRKHRFVWSIVFFAIVLAGVLSRVNQTGLLLVDKYLGDALYAAMVYVLFRLTGRIERVALWTAVAMTVIELFQLTGIPAALLRSGSLAARIFARLLGTTFSFRDLLAYVVGIGFIAALDRSKQ